MDEKETLIIERKQVSSIYFSEADHSASKKHLLHQISMTQSFHISVSFKNWVYQNKGKHQALSIKN